MEKILILLVYVSIVIAISFFIGRKKKVGFWWTIFFCSFLTPIIGFIIALTSQTKDYNQLKNEKVSSIGIILLILGIMSFLGQLNYLYKGQIVQFSSSTLWLSVGLIGSGIYRLKSN